MDAFPNNPNESVDTDGDGIGDNSDAFPNDPLESVDTDDDGAGDNTDAFPFDPSETRDTDNDGVGDNSDIYWKLSKFCNLLWLSLSNEDYYAKSQLQDHRPGSTMIGIYRASFHSAVTDGRKL